MYWQLDSKHGAVCGYLIDDPKESVTKDGRRCVTLKVAYENHRAASDDGHRHNKTLHMSVCVFGEYASYARLMSEGDCVLAIGARKLNPPRGMTVNPMSVDKRTFGIILGTGTTNAFEVEVQSYVQDKVGQRIKKSKRQNKKTEDVSNDVFKEINGDMY